MSSDLISIFFFSTEDASWTTKAQISKRFTPWPFDHLLYTKQLLSIMQCNFPFKCFTTFVSPKLVHALIIGFQHTTWNGNDNKRKKMIGKNHDFNGKSQISGLFVKYILYHILTCTAFQMHPHFVGLMQHKRERKSKVSQVPNPLTLPILRVRKWPEITQLNVFMPIKELCRYTSLKTIWNFNCYRTIYMVLKLWC